MNITGDEQAMLKTPQWLSNSVPDTNYMDGELEASALTSIASIEFFVRNARCIRTVVSKYNHVWMDFLREGVQAILFQPEPELKSTRHIANWCPNYASVQPINMSMSCYYFFEYLFTTLQAGYRDHKGDLILDHYNENPWSLNHVTDRSNMNMNGLFQFPKKYAIVPPLANNERSNIHDEKLSRSSAAPEPRYGENVKLYNRYTGTGRIHWNIIIFVMINTVAGAMFTYPSTGHSFEKSYAGSVSTLCSVDDFRSDNMRNCSRFTRAMLDYNHSASIMKDVFQPMRSKSTGQGHYLVKYHPLHSKEEQWINKHDILNPTGVVDISKCGTKHTCHVDFHGETLECIAPIAIDCRSWRIRRESQSGYFRIGYGLGPILFSAKTNRADQKTLLGTLALATIVLIYLVTGPYEPALPYMMTMLGALISITNTTAWTMVLDTCTLNMRVLFSSALQLGWVLGCGVMYTFATANSAELQFRQFHITAMDRTTYDPITILITPTLLDSGEDTIHRFMAMFGMYCLLVMVILMKVDLPVITPHIRRKNYLVALENSVLLHKSDHCPVFFIEKVLLTINAMKEAATDPHYYLTPVYTYPLIIGITMNSIAYMGGLSEDVNSDYGTSFMCSFLCVAVMSQLSLYQSTSNVLIAGSVTTFIIRSMTLLIRVRKYGSGDILSFIVYMDRAIWFATWGMFVRIWTIEVMPTIMSHYGIPWGLGLCYTIGGLCHLLLINMSVESYERTISITSTTGSLLGVIIMFSGAFIEVAPAAIGHSYYKSVPGKGVLSTVFGAPPQPNNTNQSSDLIVALFSERHAYCVILKDTSPVKSPLNDFNIVRNKTIEFTATDPFSPEEWGLKDHQRFREKWAHSRRNERAFGRYLKTMNIEEERENKKYRSKRMRYRNPLPFSANHLSPNTPNKNTTTENYETFDPRPI